MLMTTSKAFAATAAALLLAAGVAWGALAGVVTAISARDVTVSGAVYALDDDTVLEDFAHQPISRHEIRPGTMVELELDEAGRLLVLRAAVVR
jgi:hypothetical protein